jgi:hypothetical protein
MQTTDGEGGAMAKVAKESPERHKPGELAAHSRADDDV